MQEEKKKNRKLGLSQGGHGPLTQVKITVTVIKGRKIDNWPLYYTYQVSCIGCETHTNKFILTLSC